MMTNSAASSRVSQTLPCAASSASRLSGSALISASRARRLLSVLSIMSCPPPVAVAGNATPDQPIEADCRTLEQVTERTVFHRDRDDPPIPGVQKKDDQGAAIPQADHGPGEPDRRLPAVVELV